MTASQMRLDHARDSVRSEDDRAAAIQNRAAAIAAGAGVVLGLSLTLGRDLFQRQVDEAIFGPVFVVTALALLGAAACSGWALWPPGAWASPADEVARLGSIDSHPVDEGEQAAELIEVLARQLANARDSNESKTHRLRLGLAVLGVGIIGAAGLGGALAFSEPETGQTEAGAVKSPE